MAKLMGQDEQDDDEKNAQDIQRATSRAFSRPDLSASRTSSREGWGMGRWPSRAFSTRRGMAAKEMWRGGGRGRPPPLPPCLQGQLQAGEALKIGGLKGEAAQSLPVQAGEVGVFQALGVGQGILDGHGA